MRRVVLLAPGLVGCLAVALSGCGGAAQQVEVAGAHPGAAPALIKAYGCGACHTIPGVDGADANVGPALGDLAARATIAGVLPNTPRNLVHWLMSPQQVSPGTIMPDLGLGEPQARDIAAYLYRH